MRYGLIAGNGRFPLLALESARRLGHDVTVLAIQEEASPEVESLAPALPLDLARRSWASSSTSSSAKALRKS